MRPASPKKPIPAAPEYGIGQVVNYVDRHGRHQRGEVNRIEGHWPSWSPDRPPLIIYTLSHPSYRGQRMHTTSENIIGVA